MRSNLSLSDEKKEKKGKEKTKLMFDLFINIPPSLDFHFLKVRPEKKNKSVRSTIHISFGKTTRQFFSLGLIYSNCH